ncbi:MAG: hypothetical protein ACKESB_03145, partial [Candidatus Hodgkinia cicadicola]
EADRNLLLEVFAASGTQKQLKQFVHNLAAVLRGLFFLVFFSLSLTPEQQSTQLQHLLWRRTRWREVQTISWGEQRREENREGKCTDRFVFSSLLPPHSPSVRRLHAAKQRCKPDSAALAKRERGEEEGRKRERGKRGKEREGEGGGKLSRGNGKQELGCLKLIKR